MRYWLNISYRTIFKLIHLCGDINHISKNYISLLKPKKTGKPLTFKILVLSYMVYYILYCILHILYHYIYYVSFFYTHDILSVGNPFVLLRICTVSKQGSP